MNNDTTELDNLINSQCSNGDTPSYVACKPSPVYVQIRLDKTNHDDIAIEQILSDWADRREKTKNVKAAIGMYHATLCKDITYFEDNHDWLVSEIQLAGRLELQKQIDDLQQQIIALTKRQNAIESVVNNQIMPGLRWIVQRIGITGIIKQATIGKLKNKL